MPDNRIKVIYKITFPNGKLYIGKDVTDDPIYFGSMNKELVRADLTAEQRVDLTLRKEIIWQSETATDAEVNKKEIELIRQYQSNNPLVGYNRFPKWK
jgi:hypothetical protein